MEIKNLFNFGDKVYAHGDIFGYITAICLRGDYIVYEISYFTNGVYEQKWFESFEIEKAI